MMKRIRTVAVLPTLFTLANLVCGFYAIVVTARIVAPEAGIDPTPAVERIQRLQFDPTIDTHNIMISACLIFLAMIFDVLDGHVARLARAESEFGGQLDSLCDLVTFGVAPAFLLVKMCTVFTISHRYGVWVIAAAFVCCAAMRLARFNVETAEDDDHMWFSGLPVPAAAAAVVSFALLFYDIRTSSQSESLQWIDVAMQWGLPIFAALLAMLMVSRLPCPHVVNQFLRGNRSFAHVVGLLFAFVLVLLVPFYSVPLLACTFAIFPLLKFLWHRVYRRRESKEPLF